MMVDPVRKNSPVDFADNGGQPQGSERLNESQVNYDERSQFHSPPNQ